MIALETYITHQVLNLKESYNKNLLNKITMDNRALEEMTQVTYMILQQIQTWIGNFKCNFKMKRLEEQEIQLLNLMFKKR